MYGIRLKPRSSHGAATPAASTAPSADAPDRESGAGLTHSPEYKKVSGSRVSFTEYNNNTLLAGVRCGADDLLSGLGGSPSASQLSGRMLSSSSSSRSNVVSRSSYAHRAFISDTFISQAEYFGRSTVVEQAQAGGVISSKATVHSKRYTAQRQHHGGTSQQTAEVCVEHVSNGRALQLEEVRSGSSVRRKRVSFKSKVGQTPTEVCLRDTGINAVVCRSVPIQYVGDRDEDKPEDEDAAEFCRGKLICKARQPGSQPVSLSSALKCLCRLSLLLLLLLSRRWLGLEVLEGAVVGVLECLALPLWRFSWEVVSCLAVAVLFAPLSFPNFNPGWCVIQSGSVSLRCRIVVDL